MFRSIDTVSATIPQERRLVSLFVFGVAMGLLEGVVAIYLRQLYYPAGFVFPVALLPATALFVESIREAATMVMLAAVGIMAGKNHLDRFALFLYVFGVWDIFYYVALKLLIDWPASLLTWDVLFLIPIVWVGPVLAPLICACTMMLFGICIRVRQSKGRGTSISLWEGVACMAGATTVFAAFIEDYARLIIQGGFLRRFWFLASDDGFREVVTHFKPEQFNWILFALGEGLILYSLILWLRRNRVNRRRQRFAYSRF